ncbi:MAG: hypothetical protein H7A46_00805 [Verrucomicrobiales bacterium]|nr:hypothetical protein [Verrucomicrobiales bacterium]
MKRPSNWRNLLLATLIFLAGAAVGSINTIGVHRRLEDQRVQAGGLQDSLMDLLRTELELTPDQITRIEPIIAAACEEYRQETLHAMEQVDAIVRRTNERVAGELDPAQIDRLNALEASRRESEKSLKERFFNE